MSSFNQKDVDNLFTNITDIYADILNMDASYIYFSNKIETKDFIEFNSQERLMLDTLYKLILESYSAQPNKKDINIVFHNHYFRCNIIGSIGGKLINCRHMPYEFIDLRSLGLSDSILREMMHPRLNKGGLVFICGAPGNGKSTTTAALIKARLQQYAGVCITVEDPVEIPLQGKHGNGRCIQVPVETNFNDAIRSSLRAYPTGQTNILFIGEVRDSETACNVIRAAIDGRLVITTFHTDDINNAFERLISLSIKELGEDEAYNLVAEIFRFGIHQRLVKLNGKISIRANVLVDTQEVFSNIKSKRIAHIQNEKERQFTTIKAGNKIDYRIK